MARLPWSPACAGKTNYRCAAIHVVCGFTGGSAILDRESGEIALVLAPAACYPPRRCACRLRLLVEQLGQLLQHGAAELLGVDDRHGAAVVARHVVADADGDQLHR